MMSESESGLPVLTAVFVAIAKKKRRYILLGVFYEGQQAGTDAQTSLGILVIEAMPQYSFGLCPPCCRPNPIYEYLLSY